MFVKVRRRKRRRKRRKKWSRRSDVSVCYSEVVIIRNYVC